MAIFNSYVKLPGGIGFDITTIPGDPGHFVGVPDSQVSGGTSYEELFEGIVLWPRGARTWLFPRPPRLLGQFPGPKMTRKLWNDTKNHSTTCEKGWDSRSFKWNGQMFNCSRSLLKASWILTEWRPTSLQKHRIHGMIFLCIYIYNYIIHIYIDVFNRHVWG